MNGSRSGPARTRLAQRRSRATRKGIIRAALELWAERGYDSGFDDITTEEIAARAGVAKATFYLHFARKDDILFETGWLTAELLYEEALEALMAGGRTDAILDGLLVGLCRRVETVPRTALRRMLAVMAVQDARPADADRFGFSRAFTAVLHEAGQTAQVAAVVPAARLGVMLESLTFAAICDWAVDDGIDLLALLRERTAIVLAGARTVTAQDLAATSARFRGMAARPAV